ncbi:MAG: glycerol-3-phosphate 1-O-acyltransferase PlsY [Betaproteobacteria bacterium]|nr:glycerol-3-phosphate 1-O-acyltransferase PlsY [Betaproteobacteria bacterium]MBI2509964.1 glycerol-3-phosphate 1-O-acyltransferase PlsY [Betaproteobacteria bacterium]
MTLVIAALFAYLIGSISFAVLVSRAFRLPDPHSYGSGNPGATNVLRTGRRAAAALTLAGDALKGWFAVMLTQQHVIAEPAAVGVASVAVVVGHMWPAFFRFQGGKGVSTTLGVLAALDFYLAAGAVATWIVIAFFFRISSLAALVSAAFAMFFAYFLHGMGRLALEPAIAVTAIAALLVWRHRDNIRNLIAGTEGRIGGRNAGPS